MLAHGSTLGTGLLPNGPLRQIGGQLRQAAICGRLIRRGVRSQTRQRRRSAGWRGTSR
jgi:hypothetical protein